MVKITMQRGVLTAVCLTILLLYNMDSKWTSRKAADLRHIVKEITGDFNTTRTKTIKGNNNCTKTAKDHLFMTLQFRPGRTGNLLFQIYCLLALSEKFCYTGVIDLNFERFVQFIPPYFELRHVRLQKNVDRSTFYNITDVLSEAQVNQVSQHRHNWTVDDKCFGYDHFEDQEQFIRSSVRLKKHIIQEVDEYVSNTFANRSSVAIHVRRTDKINNTFYDRKYKFSDLKWYKPFIDKAMSYLKRMYSDLVFIFVSDDINWCRTNFKGQNIRFSPFHTLGHDLALIARCDHMIFTIGSYGWHGAWLGKKKTVVYSKDYLPDRYTKKVFLYPWWTGI